MVLIFGVGGGVPKDSLEVPDFVVYYGDALLLQQFLHLPRRVEELSAGEFALTVDDAMHGYCSMDVAALFKGMSHEACGTR